MRCTKCGVDNAADARFCNQCATPLSRACPKCARLNAPDAKFCSQCASALDGRAAAGADGSPARPQRGGIRVAMGEPDAAAAGDGERKTVTALFADIKGSTELEQDLDPEEARAIVDPALKLMIDAVQRYDGYVVQSTGDGIFAIFGAPVAHEDHPQRALYTALRMQDELKRYSTRLREAGNLPIEARVGVNTGEVVVRSIATGDGHTEYTPIGHTTNLASRMQALAPTGSIAISELTRKLCEGYFALKPLGPTRVKGVSEPVNVYEVTGLGALRTRLQRSAGRGLTKFVGREREMEAMRNASELARAGRGQIAAALAEAGTGKSRLFFEFKVKNQSGWMVLETFSVSHGKASAYFPVIDLLHTYFKITSDDDERSRRAKVIGAVLALDRALEETLPYLFGLLGIVEGDDPLAQMDAQVRKQRTLDAIKRILLRESLNQPLMVIFEDLHWIDEETQAFLNLLADSIANAKILLLVNYRPEYSHQWNSKTYYTQLRLDPLGQESADEMLSALLGDDQGLAQLKRLIVERTEGNPFFMEETVQVLLDEGALIREGSAARLTRPLGELKIPPTVQGILAARIDRLPAESKDLLQGLAVIGREFPTSLIRAVVAKPDDELGRMLNDLQLGEFIYEQPTVGDVEYTFKHALTQEVAYHSVLSERRALLHERAGTAIETLYADRISDHVSELARHFMQSGNAEKAAQYLAVLGQQLLERSALTESDAVLKRGLESARRVPDDTRRSQLELELSLVWMQTLRFLRGPASREVAKVVERAGELCEKVGTDAQRFSVLLSLRSTLAFSGERDAALEKSGLALELAERLQNQEMLLTACGLHGLQALVVGRYDDARRLSQRALELARSGTQRDKPDGTGAELGAKSTIAFLLLMRGYPEQAMTTFQEVVALARRTTHPFALAQSLIALYVPLFLRTPAAAREFAREALAAAETGGFVFEGARWRAMLGWTKAQQGGFDEGIAMIRDARRDIHATGAELTFGTSILLPDALFSAGRYREAVEAVDECFSLSSSPVPMLVPEIYRIKGEATLALDRSFATEAETCFRTAIELARGQSAKWWELRTTVSLARLMHDTGRRHEVRAMLRDIYGWFTEGFDTGDLKDAKALLDELNR